MSVEQLVSRRRLELGFLILLCGWVSVFFGDIFGIIVVVACIIMIIAALTAGGVLNNAAVTFRGRPMGEKILIIAAAGTLIGASFAHYYFGFIEDLGSVIMPVNVAFLLASPGTKPISKQQA